MRAVVDRESLAGLRGVNGARTSAAAWMLYRQQRKSLLCMFAGVFALGFAAAAVHRYPYGANSRLVQYLAPIICLLAGLGFAIILAKLRLRSLAVASASRIVVPVYDMKTSSSDGRDTLTDLIGTPSPSNRRGTNSPPFSTAIVTRLACSRQVCRPDTTN